ncbi:MAG TPA: ferredoxin [Mycobacterium sp.]
MKVTVDSKRCSGIGLCEMAAPGVFEIGDDGQTHVVIDPDQVDPAVFEEAIAACPTSALTLHK